VALARVLVALAVLAALGALLAYVLLNRGPNPQPGSGSQNLPPAELSPGSQLGGGQVAREVDLYFQDRDTPERTAARLIADEMAPDGARRYLAHRPRVWVYQQAGRTVHVRSDSGDLIMPARDQPPERGTLTGGVLIRLFEAGVDTSPQAIDQATPLATVRTTALDFNVRLGTLSTAELVTGKTADTTFELRGLDVRANEVTEQLERLESPGGGKATYTPPPEDKPGQPQAKTSPGQPSATPQTPPTQTETAQPAPTRNDQAPDTPPAERFYHLQLTGEVVIERQGMTADADVLDAWVRLVDNRLAPDAVGPLARGSARGVADAASLLSVVAAGLGQPQDAKTDAQPADPVTLTWTGPMVIRPLADRPPELARDQVALRLSAPRRGLVRLADASSEATGHAATIEYYPTTQRAVLIGPAANSVAFSAPGAGQARGIRIEADLPARVATFTGPGELASLGQDQRGTITWAERAVLRFATLQDQDASDGQPAQQATDLALRSASFRGKVQASARDAVLEGERLDASFYEIASPRPLVRRMVLSREPNRPAIAASDRAGRLTGDRIEALFEMAPGEPRSDPVRLIATGSVTGRDSRATFACEHLDARLLTTDAGRRVDVDQAKLSGTVRLDAVDGDGVRVAARGDELLARPADELLEVIGNDQQPASTSRGPTTITGPQIRLRGTNGTAQVFGGGSFSHETREQERRSSITLRWREFMLFNDREGTAGASGEVTASITGEDGAADRIAADSVELVFDRPPDAQGEADTRELAQGRRSLRWARAYAAQPEDRPVVLEALRRQAGGGALRSAVALLVPAIEYQADTGELLADGGGRAIILDASEPDAPEDRPDARPLERGRLAELSASGQTLADWRGSMRYSRDRSVLELRRAVRLSHRPSPEADQVDLDCEKLVLTLDDAPRRDAPTLRTARAQGAVYAATPDREIVASSLRFDATDRVMHATGDARQPVIVFDRQRAQTASAAAIRWDTATGEFIVQEPLPTQAAADLPADPG